MLDDEGPPVCFPPPPPPPPFLREDTGCARPFPPRDGGEDADVDMGVGDVDREVGRDEGGDSPSRGEDTSWMLFLDRELGRESDAADASPDTGGEREGLKNAFTATVRSSGAEDMCVGCGCGCGGGWVGGGCGNMLGEVDSVGLWVCGWILVGKDDEEKST